MTQKNNSTQLINPRSVMIRMLIGAGIGLIIISSFVFSVDNPDPNWGKFWMIRPLIISPLAGALGILSFYLKDMVRPQGNLMNALVFMFSFMGFFIALWLGIVLGLDGTLWD